jgi:ATP-binding cassette subfamily B protein
VAGVLVERLWVARELDTAAVGLAEQAGPLRRAGYFRNVALEAATAKELRIFGLADWALERFRTLWQRAMEPAWRARQRHGRLMAAAMVAVTGAYVVVAAAIALAGVRGEIDVGQVAVFLAAAAGVGAVAWTADPEWGLRMASRAVLQATALERELGAARPGQASSPVQHRRPAAGRPHREIRFEGVSFRYPGSETDVLRGLDLVIPAGRSLAIVGQNGAGKTTLVKLLARLYEPGGGRLTVDGEPLAVYDVASWRARLAVIFQDFARYELPARDNVGFGCPRLLQRPGIGEAGGTAAIERAIQRAGASEVLAALPAGLDTVLSRRYRGGADLSGGEWQRLALARCFAAVEGGAGVLVLDEPTAALDVRAEAALFERFLELTAGLTTVLISHRFSTVRRAERIVVVELGRIVEQGSHEALLARGGRYATMFRLQAARFQGAESAAGAAGGDDDV